MSSTNGTGASVTLNIKGPSALKLSISISTENTVLQLKQRIEAENKDFPAERCVHVEMAYTPSQRLIYSGKVLKDPETLESYNVKDNRMSFTMNSSNLHRTDTIHMVRAAIKSSGPSNTMPASSTSSKESATRAAESQGVPAGFSAGQQFMNNPLSALNRADYAGPHTASLLNEAGGMFGNFGGMNPRDPNVMMGMMQNPEFLQHMRDMLSRPEVIDQIIASNPQMQAMGPQVREMMRSEYFRDMITNPETIQRMTQLSQILGGGGGAGLGGAAPTWPPPGAFGAPTSQPSAGTDQNSSTSTTVTNAANAGNPLASLAQLQQMLGGVGGAGTDPASMNPLAALASLGGAGTQAPTDSRPPEERYATQLEQLQNMGFFDARANLRALLMSGGSVEAALSILLD